MFLQYLWNSEAGFGLAQNCMQVFNRAANSDAYTNVPGLKLAEKFMNILQWNKKMYFHIMQSACSASTECV